jgi:hypothetical protein
MYTTQMLAGRAYQSYLPDPLVPVVSGAWIAEFRRFDRLLSRDCDAAAFTPSARDAIARAGVRHRGENRQSHASAALAALLTRERIGPKQLKQINGLLTDAGSSELRAVPVWMGAPHPGLSWHVGSPPHALNGLIKRLLQTAESDWPASLHAVMAMFRLLQIHPFVDGNGRTARFYAIWRVHRGIGPSLGFLRLLDALWDRARLDMNAVSLSAQSENSLDPILACVADLVPRACAS